ncbi:MAG: protoheme IX farnesyltransferase, partial [Alphaproteobacteria bacterium]|nr:protoheme IX farnesyltransferase [Alphaproteobacteria bacterium]
MFKAYTELFRLKPIGLILSMVLFAHFFALGETGLEFNWTALLLLLGTTGIANAASFGLNQYYERDADAKMERTKNRPIPSGKILPKMAFVSSLGLFIVSIGLQYVLINGTTALATLLCGGIYIWTYTPLKSRSNLSTLVGSLPGALLPFIGWFSVTQGFNLVIVWMSLMIFLWQIPHTFVIIFRYNDEFASAGGKQLPFVIGEKAALRQSLWYTLYNIPLIFIPVLFKVSGGVYLFTAILATSIA